MANWCNNKFLNKLNRKQIFYFVESISYNYKIFNFLQSRNPLENRF